MKRGPAIQGSRRLPRIGFGFFSAVPYSSFGFLSPCLSCAASAMRSSRLKPMCHSFASSGNSGVDPQGWAIMVITSPQRMVAARRAVAFRHVVRQPRVFKSIKHCEIASVPQLGFTVALQQFPIDFGCERFVNPGWDSPRQCSALLCSLDFIPCVSKDVHLQSPSHRPNNSFKFACSGASQSARSSYVTSAQHGV